MSTTTQTPKLRLTQRGRVVIASFLTVIAIAVFVMIAIIGATNAQANTGVGEQLATQFETIVAIPGDTMWSIATVVAPESDPREVIEDIIRLNQLSSADLVVGQELSIPQRYSNS